MSRPLPLLHFRGSIHKSIPKLEKAFNTSSLTDILEVMNPEAAGDPIIPALGMLLRRNRNPTEGRKG